MQTAHAHSLILAIESSCDDTAAAVLQDGKVLATVVNVQDAHAAQGGIVPELASRLHQQQISRVVEAALQQAHVSPQQLTAVACTGGPGLMGALLVGVSFAKAYALARGVPFVAVDHLHGHLMSAFAADPAPAFPFICLIASGGHSLVLRVDTPLKYAVLSQTRDDAAGEAFDKTARLLGFSYPGGPLLDKAAQTGNPHFVSFPIPLAGTRDFSFSGLKTAVLYHLQKATAKDPAYIDSHRADLAASIQHSIVSALTQRLQDAVADTGISRVAVVGGVAANSGLRTALHQLADSANWHVHIPPMAYCTDNAAMIGLAAHALLAGGLTTPLDFVPYAQHRLFA